MEISAPGRGREESSAPARNWRWMLASAGIGAGFGLVAGLQRLGREPAQVLLEVALTALRGAVVFFVLAERGVVAVRFVRRLRSTPRD